MIRTFLALAVVIGVFTSLSVFMPDPLITGIDEALVYFFQSMWGLSPVLDVSVLMVCLKILVNFIISVAVFWIFRWAFKLLV